MVAAQELGAALHASPYAGLVAGGYALAHGEAAGGDELVDEIVAGRRIVAFGVLDAPFELGGGRVTGTTRLVDGVPGADSLVLAIPASTDLAFVADLSDCTVEPLRFAFDESRPCGDVQLEGASVAPLAAPRAALHLYKLLLAADALGGLQRMLSRTVDYARERRAFGQPIGSFQAVQHRLVDHSVRVRAMTLIVAQAARVLASSASDGAREVALAELVVTSGAVHVLHDLLQLTGAIGFTWEHGLHRYERRAHHDARLAGNPRAAVRALAEREGWTR